MADDTKPADVPAHCPFHRWREDFPIEWEADGKAAAVP